MGIGRCGIISDDRFPYMRPRALARGSLTCEITEGFNLQFPKDLLDGLKPIVIQAERQAPNRLDLRDYTKFWPLHRESA